jgi:peptidoglycan hydrolase CwlO-like protein
MKNIFIIVLSLVLAAAIIFGIVLYGKYADTKDALLTSKEKLSELNEKIIQLDQEISALDDQIEKNTERFKELENAKERAVELENTIKVKNQGLLSFEERLYD